MTNDSDYLRDQLYSTVRRMFSHHLAFRANVVCFVASLLVFFCLAGWYWDFVLDDSFITFRYAENLASGSGFVWNRGEDPVEGFTSMLWVLVTSLAFICGFDPLIWARLVSIGAVFLTLRALSKLLSSAHWSAHLALLAPIALSPAFALLTTQGMETALTAALLCGTAVAAIRIVTHGVSGNDVPLHIFAFLAVLSRPDSAVFLIGFYAALTMAVFFSGEATERRRFFSGVLVLGLCGGAYFAWRWWYFGHPFPNTFYIKMGFGAREIKRRGLNYTASFVLEILLPYLLLLGFLLFKKAPWKPVVAPLLGCATFLSYLTMISPIQGFLWRFAMPIVPAFLAALAFLIGQRFNQTFTFRKNSTALFFAALFVAWSGRTYMQAEEQREWRDPHDRVVVGQSLSGLSGTMFVSESGALPFLSKWRAVDLLGLNSERIAHHGLSAEILRELNPDLVMLRYPSAYRPTKRTEQIVNDYLVQQNFRALAAIYKRVGQHHFYFVRSDSPLRSEIERRILGLDAVTYGDLKELVKEPRLLGE